MSLIPVLINAGSLLTPVLCTLLSSSLALSFVNGVSKDALVHPRMSVETIKGPCCCPLSITELCVVLVSAQFSKLSTQINFFNLVFATKYKGDSK